MGLRFYRRIRIAPGVRLNLSGSGISASVGRRGAWYTVGAGGRRQVTLGVPGTGLRYTSSLPAVKGHRQGWLLALLVLAIAGFLVAQAFR